ncbi:MAG: hypothetical protein MMC23_007955 [Stictis urceolatum]|nr:hypothetical protein [Stictis urceolata]
MVSLILPTMGYRLANMTEFHVTQVSRGISVILIFVYAVYLFFLLKTHASMYSEPSKKVEAKRSAKEKAIDERGTGQAGKTGAQSSATIDAITADDFEDEEDEEDERQPRLRIVTVIVLLILCTTLFGFNTFFATESFQGLMDHTGLSPTFVGIVLLPLLSNDVTVVGPATMDKIDICILLTVGKCVQMILLVVPFSVLLGWIMDRDMSLNFDAFEVVALFASVIYINSMIQDGSSTYLDGVLLPSVFLINCLTSF